MEDTHKSKTKPEAFNEAFTPTARVDPRAVVVVTVGDVQQVAQQTINRDLSSIELMQVQAILKAGLGNRTEIIQDAICMVLDVQRVPDPDLTGIELMQVQAILKTSLKAAFLQDMLNTNRLTVFEIRETFGDAITEYRKVVEAK